jgi:hypothetical protein
MKQQFAAEALGIMAAEAIDAGLKSLRWIWDKRKLKAITEDISVL